MKVWGMSPNFHARGMKRRAAIGVVTMPMITQMAMPGREVDHCPSAISVMMPMRLGSRPVKPTRATASSQVSFVQAKLDWDDGRQIYEIEFYTSDGTEYDYEISAAGGQVISCDFDAEHNGKRTQAGRQKASQGNSAGETSASADEITQDEAKAIALEQAGLGESQVSRIRIHRDRDDGRTVYEGSFVSGETEYEFEISASDGRILEWDRESIYD